MKFFILFLFIAPNCFASDFELISFSHKEKLITLENAISISNMDTESFEQLLGCNNKDRFELFTNYLTPLKKEPGIYLMNNDGKLFKYLSGVITSLDGVRQDAFISSTFKTLQKINSYHVGRTLLQKIENSPYDFYIKEGWPHAAPNTPNESNSYQINNSTFVVNTEYRSLQVKGMIFNSIGSGGSVFWNPKSKLELIEEDNVSRKVSHELVLAHELYHAYDTLRGFIDRRLVFGENYEQTEVTEYRAVRFENTLRKEMGKLKRKYYSNSQGSDLLDDQGETIIMPSPCITF